MPPMNTTAATLFSLPVEIVELITDHLEAVDHGSLRHTCKTIDALVVDRFAKTYFSTRLVMLEHVGLNNILDIAEHPRLSRYVRCIMIFTAVLDTMYGMRGSAPGPSRGPLMLLLTGYTRNMLSQAFSRLPNLESLHVRDRELEFGSCVRTKPWGWNGPGMRLRMANTTLSPRNIVPVALSALGASSTMPAVLDLKSFERPLGPLTLEIFSRTLVTGRMIAVLAGLEHLSLKIHISGPLVDSDIGLDILEHLISKTPNLKHLAIDFCTLKDQQPLHFIMWLGKWPAVERCMDGEPVPSTTLARLQSLELENTSVSHDVLCSVLTSLGLERIALRRLMLLPPFHADNSTFKDNDARIWPTFLMSLSSRFADPHQVSRFELDIAAQGVDPDSLPVPVTFDTPTCDHRCQLPSVWNESGLTVVLSQWLLDLSKRVHLHLPEPVDDSDGSENYAD